MQGFVVVGAFLAGARITNESKAGRGKPSPYEVKRKPQTKINGAIECMQCFVVVDASLAGARITNESKMGMPYTRTK
jgi:hypothetical protein